jgi:uncharacterized membrane protein
MPFWALTLVFWLHMLSTVIWLGSLAAITIIILPAIRGSLEPDQQLTLIDAMQRRLEPIAWFSLAVLIVTGLFQMSSNPHYDGFLSTSTQWALAILSKHILVAVMVVASAVQTWEVLPAIRRTLILVQKGKGDEAEIQALRRRETRLMRVNLVLSVLILAATAFARSS